MEENRQETTWRPRRKETSEDRLPGPRTGIAGFFQPFQVYALLHATFYGLLALAGCWGGLAWGAMVSERFCHDAQDEPGHRLHQNYALSHNGHMRETPFSVSLALIVFPQAEGKVPWITVCSYRVWALPTRFKELKKKKILCFPKL